MDVRLATFITVAKTKNFTRAASILNMTQPAISQQIKFLEEYYRVPLFNKKKKNMELTEEGKLLLKYALEMDRLSRRVKAELENQSGIIKKYNLGATLTIGGYVLPVLIGQFKSAHPNIELTLQVENTETIIKKLYSGEIDLGIIEGPFDREKVNYVKFKDDELVLAVAKQHPFARKKWVSMEEVLRDRLILREKGSGTRQVFEYYLQQAGYELDDSAIYMEIGDITAIISLVELNLGCTIISREVLRQSLKNRTIRIIPIKGFRFLREFNFIFLSEADQGFIDGFIRFCRETAM